MGDIYISNGTCYGSAGNELDKSFIPCGNAAFGPVTCCGAGDVCLSNNACFGVHGTPGSYGADLTYLAGCTDESYRDGSCPDKYGIDQPWIALTVCDDSGGDWAPCPQEGSPTTLQNGAYCSCTDAASTTVAINNSPRLADIARLPQTTGGTVSFFPGNEPTNTSPPAQTTGGGNGGGQSSSQSQSPSQSQPQPGTTGQPPNTGSSNTSSSPIPSETGSPGSDSGTGSDSGSDPTGGGGGGSSSSGGGLNSGAKIGIGIGAAIGGLILIATLLTLWHYNRKNRRSASGAAGIEEGGEKPKKAFAPVPSPRASEADSNPVSEADGKAVTRPWSMRSELEGNNTAAAAAGKKAPTANGNQKVNTDGAARPGVGELDGREVQELPPHHDLSPVAELPGSEAWAQAPGGGRGRV